MKKRITEILDRQTALLSVLVRGVTQYMLVHDDICRGRYNPKKCDCGLAKLQEEAREILTPTPPPPKKVVKPSAFVTGDLVACIIEELLYVCRVKVSSGVCTFRDTDSKDILIRETIYIGEFIDDHHFTSWGKVAFEGEDLLRNSVLEFQKQQKEKDNATKETDSSAE
jgi:hypothetical protein